MINYTAEAFGTALRVLFGDGVVANVLPSKSKGEGGSANAQAFAPPGNIDLSVVFSGGLQPMLVGGLVLGVRLSLGGPTGYAINPARDLGPRIAHAPLPIPGKR